MLILRLALRAIRWRAAASAAVFVVAGVAILAATVGPIYLHAVDDTVLATHLKDASVFQRDVLVSLRTRRERGVHRREYAVVGRDGSLQLPPELFDEFPPGTLLDVRRDGREITLVPRSGESL